ncbi:MAG: NAD(P)H-hydrate dehydratase [Clostridia bacterium]|nr:NAD(P)H-hydrate dehydratase [Clostridia bacterium]
MTIQLNRETAQTLLPHRDDRQAKWQFGRTALTCGSAAMSGAALMAAQGALRSGAGLVQLCSVPEVICAARTAVPEALLLEVPRQEAFPGAIHAEGTAVLLEQAQKAQSLLFGCGAGITDHGRALLESLCGGFSGTLVLDADGLNLLSENVALLYKVQNRAVLTPHIGEFCRLSGLPKEQVQTDPVKAAVDLAAQYRCAVVLKGPETVITDGARIYVLDCPNSGMAKGGSGDLLAGLTAGLCAQMPQKPLECAALAVWLHSRAGQLARSEQSAFAMLPRDVLNCLGRALLELE